MRNTQFELLNILLITNAAPKIIYDQLIDDELNALFVCDSMPDTDMFPANLSSFTDYADIPYEVSVAFVNYCTRHKLTYGVIPPILTEWDPNGEMPIHPDILPLKPT